MSQKTDLESLNEGQETRRRELRGLLSRAFPDPVDVLFLEYYARVAGRLDSSYDLPQPGIVRSPAGWLWGISNNLRKSALRYFGLHQERTEAVELSVQTVDGRWRLYRTGQRSIQIQLNGQPHQRPAAFEGLTDKGYLYLLMKRLLVAVVLDAPVDLTTPPEG